MGSSSRNHVLTFKIMKPYAYYLNLFKFQSTGPIFFYFWPAYLCRRIGKQDPGIVDHQSLSREDREDREKSKFIESRIKEHK